jgi:hypothetical protein
VFPRVVSPMAGSPWGVPQVGSQGVYPSRIHIGEFPSCCPQNEFLQLLSAKVGPPTGLHQRWSLMGGPSREYHKGVHKVEATNLDKPVFPTLGFPHVCTHMRGSTKGFPQDLLKWGRHSGFPKGGYPKGVRACFSPKKVPKVRVHNGGLPKGVPQLVSTKEGQRMGFAKGCPPVGDPPFGSTLRGHPLEDHPFGTTLLEHSLWTPHGNPPW